MGAGGLGSRSRQVCQGWIYQNPTAASISLHSSALKVIVFTMTVRRSLYLSLHFAIRSKAILLYIQLECLLSQQTFTCSSSTIETPNKEVQYVQS